MYLIPLIVFAVVVLIALAWTPIFAVIIAVPLFLLFLGYVGLSRRGDQRAARPSGAPASGEGGTPTPGVGGNPDPPRT